MDDPSLHLVLRHLLLVREDASTEDKPLSVRRDANSLADLFFKLTHSVVWINLLKFVIRPVEGLNCEGPHACVKEV